MSADYLILGAGISGSLLARALAKRGNHVVLLHSPLQPGSSPVAAWMMTPITGLRFSVSWRIETLLPYAKATYREIERESGLKLLHEQRILRFLKSRDEAERWAKKEGEPGMKNYARTLDPADFPEWDTYGCVEILGGGWVDLTRWLSLHQSHPGAGIECVSAHLTADDLLIEKDHVKWKDRTFKKALFCTGYSHWPWFDWLPWKAAKGETLTVRIPGLNLNDIIKKDLFLLPLGDDLYRIGATYTWSPLDDHPTEEGRSQLLQALQKLVPLPAEVIFHHAGVRPSFQGTLPAVGLHPRYSSLGILNGLGSKGSLSAPWLAEHLASHLEEGTPLDPEVDLARN